LTKGLYAFSSQLLKERLRKSQALIEEGFNLQRANEIESAKSRFKSALSLTPDHPTALQLLGLIEKQTGNVEGARALMQRSLHINPNQAHVWNNLSNTLFELGLFDQALAALNQALNLKDNYGDALLNRAKIYLQRLEYQNALVDIERGIEQSDANLTHFLSLKAQILEKQGQLLEAESCLRIAIGSNPLDGTLHHNLAVILHRLNRYQESLAAHQAAKTLGLESADSLYNLGNTLQSLGELGKASEAYEQACVINPGHLLAQGDLASLRWRLKDPAWHRTLSGAIQKLTPSSNARLIGRFAQLLWHSGSHDQALEAWERVAALEPDKAQWKDAVGRCLVRLGHLSEGLKIQRTALNMEKSALQHASLATSLIIAGDFEEANEHATQSCLLQPLDQYAWAIRELCWRALSDPRHVWLFEPNHLIHVEDLEPPSGWSGMPSFNRELEEALLSMHHDSEAPIDQTLRNGTQTFGNLFEQSNPHVNALLNRIRPAIDRFIKSLSKDQRHPFLGRIGQNIFFESSWSTRLKSNGFHTNHVHPAGWLSLAYYVAVPAVCSDIECQKGWLQFGEPESLMPSTLKPLKLIEPKVGRLVLFPSYVWHGTTTFDPPQHRMAISADVLPAW
jgi:uncharacterized protein (TIGR02466 family)